MAYPDGYVPTKTLFERFTEGYTREYWKHKDEDGEFSGCYSAGEYREFMVNSMTNYEFLDALSEAMEEL